jgi:hypothetical protein
MTGFGLNKRTRAFLLWTARLALLAYLVQIMAIDHWHAHTVDIIGLEGSSAHVAHCHGGGGDCADGGGAATSAVSDVATIPLPPSVAWIEAAGQDRLPAAAFIETPYRPPRAS